MLSFFYSDFQVRSLIWPSSEFITSNMHTRWRQWCTPGKRCCTNSRRVYVLGICRLGIRILSCLCERRKAMRRERKRNKSANTPVCRSPPHGIRCASKQTKMIRWDHLLSSAVVKYEEKNKLELDATAAEQSGSRREKRGFVAAKITYLRIHVPSSWFGSYSIASKQSEGHKNVSSRFLTWWLFLLRRISYYCCFLFDRDRSDTSNRRIKIYSSHWLPMTRNKNSNNINNNNVNSQAATSGRRKICHFFSILFG